MIRNFEKCSHIPYMEPLGIIHPAFKALFKYRELVLNVVGDFQGFYLLMLDVAMLLMQNAWNVWVVQPKTKAQCVKNNVVHIWKLSLSQCEQWKSVVGYRTLQVFGHSQRKTWLIQYFRSKCLTPSESHPSVRPVHIPIQLTLSIE